MDTGHALQVAELTPKPITEYVRFETAFRALDRIYETMQDAISHCNRCDFDPTEIYPVTVAYEAPVEQYRPLQKQTVRVERYFIFDYGKDMK